MDIQKYLNEFIESNQESLPMIYDILRTITIQFVVQLLFTMNNSNISFLSITFLQTTLFLILGTMVFWLIIYKTLSTKYLKPLYFEKLNE
tara:strand:- start:447 stop:716 length:270 start_codon:yes stop_codon:yes gene_type:complete